MNTYDMTIGELTVKMVAEARRLGYSEATIWRSWMPLAGMVVKYYKEQGLYKYDPAVTNAFLEKIQNRYEAKEISEPHFKQMRQIIRRLNEFYLTGTFRSVAALRGTQYILSSENEQLVDMFVAHQGYGANTREDAIWAVRKYLHYFENRGHKTLADVSVDDVRYFMLQVAHQVKTSTLYDLFLYLRHFHIYLAETGMDAPACAELFSHRVYRDMPIQSHVTDKELERILNVVDTSTEVGKRNRAIILLGATTGLRACDIIRLKLTDIDWRKGEIRIVQEKTGCTVRLPLLCDTGAAIQDYILNARPKMDVRSCFCVAFHLKRQLWTRYVLEPCSKIMHAELELTDTPLTGKGFTDCGAG